MQNTNRYKKFIKSQLWTADFILTPQGRSKSPDRNQIISPFRSSKTIKEQTYIPSSKKWASLNRSFRRQNVKQLMIRC